MPAALSLHSSPQGRGFALLSNRTAGRPRTTLRVSRASSYVAAVVAGPLPDATTAPVMPENLIPALRCSSASGTRAGGSSCPREPSARSSLPSAPARAARSNESGDTRAMGSRFISPDRIGDAVVRVWCFGLTFVTEASIGRRHWWWSRLSSGAATSWLGVHRQPFRHCAVLVHARRSPAVAHGKGRRTGFEAIALRTQTQSFDCHPPGWIVHLSIHTGRETPGWTGGGALDSIESGGRSCQRAREHSHSRPLRTGCGMKSSHTISCPSCLPK